MNLSQNFTLEELTHSDIAVRHGWDNTADLPTIQNLRRLAGLLEQVRSAIGNRPIMVTSGYRSKQVNDAVGSKDTSQHRLGCAADIKVPGLTPKMVIEACIAIHVPFDQIILEFDSWTHISVPNVEGQTPRGQRLIIDTTGTRNYP